MKVLYVATECKPFSKAGGVADVAGELPVELRRQGVDIEVVTPMYGCVDRSHVGDLELAYDVAFHGRAAPMPRRRVERVEVRAGDLRGVPVHFVGNGTYFEGDFAEPYVNSAEFPYRHDALRFSFLSEACLRLVVEWQPDIVHVNDWPLGYLFGRMVMERLPAARVLTIHNVNYQGNVWIGNIEDWQLDHDILRDARVGRSFLDPHHGWDSVNPLRLGMESAHRVNTVSPTYAQEIMRPEDPDRFFEGGKGLERVATRLRDEGRWLGILNGFDYREEPTEVAFDATLKRKAEMKKALAKHFPANPEGFLLGFVGRAVEQKFRLLAETIAGKSVLEHILAIPGVNVAVLGAGEARYEQFMRRFARDNCFCTVAFDRELAACISLGSDVFLMPSLFEPCGIAQLEAMANATPPLARRTGGLADTVRPHTEAAGTGFVFDGSRRDVVLRNLVRAVHDAADLYANDPKRFASVQRAAFNVRHRWADSAANYVDHVYEPALAR